MVILPTQFRITLLEKKYVDFFGCHYDFGRGRIVRSQDKA